MKLTSTTQQQRQVREGETCDAYCTVLWFICSWLWTCTHWRPMEARGGPYADAAQFTVLSLHSQNRGASFIVVHLCRNTIAGQFTRHLSKRLRLETIPTASCSVQLIVLLGQMCHGLSPLRADRTMSMAVWKLSYATPCQNIRWACSQLRWDLHNREETWRLMLFVMEAEYENIFMLRKILPNVMSY